MPKDRSKIKLEENGKSAVFLNPNRKNGLQAIRVDGCVAQQGTRADFVIEFADRAVIVELKGRDVEHAASQVMATADHWKFDLQRCGEIAGLIVAARYPKASSTIQIKQDEFRRRYLNPLHVVCRNAEYSFESIFKFRIFQKNS